MSRPRVLIVEDSATIRARLAEIVGGDPGFELVAVAADGKEAIDLCHRHRPDVVSMDMMLPVMTGLAATEFIMAHCPTPILIVSSSVNRGEVFRTYDALAAGAVDVLDKPTGLEPDGEWEGRFLAALRLVARIKVITHPRARLAPPPAAGSAAPSPSNRDAPIEVVAIGASTGGPSAIVQTLAALPPRFDLPILLVLHLHELFAPAFAEWLDRQTPIRAAYARDGDWIGAHRGHVLLAPPGRHMTVAGGRIALVEGPLRHSCRPSVDVLFESVAGQYRRRAAGVLLTGMGRDGAAGLLAMRMAGALTMAQDEATSVVYGMPREAALLGAAERILPLDAVGRELAALSGVGVGAR